MKNTKKVLIVNPYLNTLGGGELHILQIAKVYENKGYTIYLDSNNTTITKHIEKRLKLHFKELRTLNFRALSLIKKILLTKSFDTIFYVTDGSYFFSLARHNYIFCMYPNKILFPKSSISFIKRLNWNIIVNSIYTKQFIDKFSGKTSKVIYPFLDKTFLSNFSSQTKKEKIILSVGRFFQHLHSKKQEIVIEAFNKLQKEDIRFSQFKLILIGGLNEKDYVYFKKIKDLTNKNSSIRIHTNSSRDNLLKYYKKSMFYWHAAGFGVDETKHPDQVEHLGITPLEAMASGCIVMVHNSGGQKVDIITQSKNGFCYRDTNELIKITVNLLDNSKKREKISQYAREFVSEKFSYQAFEKTIINTFHI